MFENLKQRLFGEKTEFVGFAEEHPSLLLADAITAIGEDPRKELASPDNYDSRAADKREELSYWGKWRNLVFNSGAAPEAKTYALLQLDAAEQTVLAEMEAIETEKPDILFLEGSQKYPCSPIGMFAERKGVRVVYLDDGYQPYFDSLENKCDEVAVQKDREKYWQNRVRSMTGEIKSKSMAIVGKAHFVPGAISRDNPVAGYVGNFPKLVKIIGMDFRLMDSGCRYSR